jgi:hypothetical protein
MISSLEPEMDLQFHKQKEEVKPKVSREEFTATPKVTPKGSPKGTSPPSLTITSQNESTYSSSMESYIILLCLLIISLHPSKVLLKYLSYFNQYDYIVLAVIVVFTHIALITLLSEYSTN